jgi:serine/threonine-protein kinase HipA
MAVMARSPLYRLRDIERRHFNAMAARMGYGQDAEPILQKVIEATPGVIEEVRGRIPKGFPERVAARVFDGLQGAANHLGAMAAR